MRTNKLIVYFGCLICCFGCEVVSTDETASTKENETQEEVPSPQLELEVLQSFVTDTNEHFRGLEIKNGTAYIAGSLGSIYTIKLDSAKLNLLYKAEGRHLRDIDVLPNGDILALAITEPAQILLKEAESDSFKVVHQNEDTLAFLDGIDFWNDKEGIAFGDPLNNYPYFLMTGDGGHSWHRLPREVFTDGIEEFAGFAASGTSLVCLDDGKFITGLGNETAKVLLMSEMGEKLILQDIPYHVQPEGTGIYSMAFKNKLNGAAVGGHWQNITCDSSKVYTSDGGKTWHLSTGIQEYRSCVTYFKDDIYISTGTTGTDISYDGGKSWQLLDTIGYNAIAFQEDGTGVAVGSYGIIHLLELSLTQK